MSRNIEVPDAAAMDIYMDTLQKNYAHSWAEINDPVHGRILIQRMPSQYADTKHDVSPSEILFFTRHGYGLIVAQPEFRQDGHGINWNLFDNPEMLNGLVESLKSDSEWRPFTVSEGMPNGLAFKPDGTEMLKASAMSREKFIRRVTGFTETLRLTDSIMADYDSSPHPILPKL